MRLSPYFAELKSAYEAELEDLMTDSAGHDVLAKRLKAKRGQLPQLLPMLECNPEMVAVAFHGGMRFASPEVMRDLALLEPEDLPPWSALLGSISLESWAADLARIVLENPNGEQFLVVTACLEFLQGRFDGLPAASGRQSVDQDFDEAEDDFDLDEAGAEWLAEQGFDRRDQFSGDH
ncbi:MAG: hypothetical protein NFW04_03115 [Candidatus Accumulibacter sp.]|uniref:hypothetical protein n=1 Tax=Accumulibacter sp. TaxID=2053492 RepID=UPI0025F1E0F3|nr:hypothetical protein [Accumulibacter sp.]MCM8597639.1 hypothetical protein [Accumulibacter sp.]MCM8661623.1 hypothetical protein [Accumulibacter sp.]